MVVEIRQAMLDDVTNVNELQQQFIKEHEILYDPEFYELSSTAREEWTSWLKERMISQEFVMFVAEDNKKIVAYISGYLEQRPKVYALRNVGYISNLYVDPKARGKGVASRLNKHIGEWFQKNGVKYVELNVDARATDAVAAWVSMGYSEVGKRMRKCLP